MNESEQSGLDMSGAAHLGRVMGNALRRFDGRVLELMAQDPDLPLKWANYLRRSVVTAAQLHLVRHLPVEGTTLVDMASRAGMSKQAMKSLVDQGEGMGLVSREAGRAAGARDGRVKWIRYTATGVLWRQAFYRAVEQAQRECERDLGKQVLTVILIGLEAYGGDCDSAYER